MEFKTNDFFPESLGQKCECALYTANYGRFSLNFFQWESVVFSVPVSFVFDDNIYNSMASKSWTKICIWFGAIAACSVSKKISSASSAVT